MPPKQKTTLEKLKQERRQLRRTSTKIFNEASVHLTTTFLAVDDIALLNSSFDAFDSKFSECSGLEKELRDIASEIEDEVELDEFFDEVDSVTIVNRGKLNKLEFVLSKYAKTSTPPASSPQQSFSSATTFTRSKLPDLNLPTFDGNITEWFGFWERFHK